MHFTGEVEIETCSRSRDKKSKSKLPGVKSSDFEASKSSLILVSCSCSTIVFFNLNFPKSCLIFIQIFWQDHKRRGGEGKTFD